MEDKSKGSMTEEQQLAAERDAKRRRVRYRTAKVHTKSKTYSEVMREVINNQMFAYENWLRDHYGNTCQSNSASTVKESKKEDDIKEQKMIWLEWDHRGNPHTRWKHILEKEKRRLENKESDSREVRKNRHSHRSRERSYSSSKRHRERDDSHRSRERSYSSSRRHRERDDSHRSRERSYSSSRRHQERDHSHEDTYRKHRRSEYEYNKKDKESYSSRREQYRYERSNGGKDESYGKDKTSTYTDNIGENKRKRDRVKYDHDSGYRESPKPSRSRYDLYNKQKDASSKHDSSLFENQLNIKIKKEVDDDFRRQSGSKEKDANDVHHVSKVRKLYENVKIKQENKESSESDNDNKLNQLSSSSHVKKLKQKKSMKKHKHKHKGGKKHKKAKQSEKSKHHISSEGSSCS